jgi:hypothetical protein
MYHLPPPIWKEGNPARDETRCTAFCELLQQAMQHESRSQSQRGPKSQLSRSRSLPPRCLALRDLLRRCWRWKACFGHNHGPPQGVRRTCCLIQQGRHTDTQRQLTIRRGGAQVAAAARITHSWGLSGQKSRSAGRELPRRGPNKRLHWFCRSPRVACSTAGLAGSRWRAERGRLWEQGRAASATGRRARARGRPLRAQACALRRQAKTSSTAPQLATPPEGWCAGPPTTGP